MALIVGKSLNCVKIGNIDLISCSNVINELPVLLGRSKHRVCLHPLPLFLNPDVVVAHHPDVGNCFVVYQSRQPGKTEEILLPVIIFRNAGGGLLQKLFL